jgi:L-iditol 2-dehydrogenase
MKKFPIYMLSRPSTFQLIQRSERPLADDFVRIENQFCGICGSDISTFEGRRNTSYPLTMGHEFVAKVSALGRNAKGFSVGDLVTSDLNYRCLECLPCQKGKTHLCEKGQIGLFSNRAFSLFSDIHTSYLEKIPYPSPEPFLTLAEPLSCVLHAYKKVCSASADRVLVIGAGGLGLCLSFLLVHYAHCPFDIVEQSKSRREKIRSCLDRDSRALYRPEGQYDLVFDVSGTPDGLLLACQSIANGGILCSMSHLDGYGDSSFLLPELTRKDATLHLSYLNGNRENLRESISLLVNKWAGNWNLLLNTHRIKDLQTTFVSRRDSIYNKDILDLSPLHSNCPSP